MQKRDRKKKPIHRRYSGHMMEIDATGLTCPMPVLRLQKHLRDMAPGSRVTLLATDTMAAIDVPHFCQEQGHILLGQKTQAKAAPGGGTLLVFEIEKRRA